MYACVRGVCCRDPCLPVSPVRSFSSTSVPHADPTRHARVVLIADLLAWVKQSDTVVGHVCRKPSESVDTIGVPPPQRSRQTPPISECSFPDSSSLARMIRFRGNLAKKCMCMLKRNPANFVRGHCCFVPVEEKPRIMML
ncbi:unnamed protein product, partial [Ectocarpus sp. 12 AP-2014]